MEGIAYGATGGDMLEDEMDQTGTAGQPLPHQC